MFIFTYLLTMIFLLWMAGRIWKSSPMLALGSFIFLPLAIIPLIQNWGDEETDIKVPFFLALGCSAYSMYSLISYAKEDPESQESLLWMIQSFA